MKISVFGLQRSGTHFLEKLIYHNLDCELDLNHDKHVCNKEDILKYYFSNSVIVYKLPHKWIDSLTRASYNLYNMYDFKPEKDHTIIDIIWDMTDDKFKHRKKIKVSLEKLCWYYNNYYNFWFEQIKLCNYYKFIRYEKLLFETKNILRKISEEIGSNQINKIHSFERVYGSKKFSESHKKYYQKNDVYTFLDKSHINVIDRNIDQNILERLKSYERNFYK